MALPGMETKKEMETQTDVLINLEGESSGKFLSNDDLMKIGTYFVYDETGNRHQMQDLWAEFKTIFVFVRSFLCFTSKEYVEDLALIPREYFKDQQVRLVVIGCAQWKHIKDFRKLTKFPYFIFCDTDYDIYNRLGFAKNKDYGNINDSFHVKSSTFKGLMSSAYRAVRSSTMDYQGNFNQQGGCLIVGPGNVVHYFHADKHARDHLPINFILNKVGIKSIDFKNAPNQSNDSNKVHKV